MSKRHTHKRRLAVHSFNSDTMPPLCGQKDSKGRRYLPAGCCSTSPDRVTCANCVRLMSDAVTGYGALRAA